MWQLADSIPTESGGYARPICCLQSRAQGPDRAHRRTGAKRLWGTKQVWGGPPRKSRRLELPRLAVIHFGQSWQAGVYAGSRQAYLPTPLTWSTAPGPGMPIFLEAPMTPLSGAESEREPSIPRPPLNLQEGCEQGPSEPWPESPARRGSRASNAGVRTSSESTLSIWQRG